MHTTITSISEQPQKVALLNSTLVKCHHALIIICELKPSVTQFGGGGVAGQGQGEASHASNLPPDSS